MVQRCRPTRGRTGRLPAINHMARTTVKPTSEISMPTRSHSVEEALEDDGQDGEGSGSLLGPAPLLAVQCRFELSDTHHDIRKAWNVAEDHSADRVIILSESRAHVGHWH